MNAQAITERLDDLLHLIDQPCSTECSDTAPCRTCLAVATIHDMKADLIA